MGRRAYRSWTAEERTVLWERWRSGMSISAIGRELGKQTSAVDAVVRSAGGIVPYVSRRSRLALTVAEREEISRELVAGKSARQIAAALGRSPSTVSREIERHGGRDRYRATQAEVEARTWAKRPKTCLLATRLDLQQAVAGKLKLNWSPVQISGWLKVEYRDDESMRISHETIYRSLFIQSRGLLKRELMAHLRVASKIRRSKLATNEGQSRGTIVDAISIRERPAEVEDRAVPGHWEGDLITGSYNTHIATLVERHTRFVMLVKVEGKDSASVVSALSRQVSQLPVELRRSLTWDRGNEMARHKLFTVATNVQVYFCDPQSPWQRGSNENTNGLLRQYFPKGTRLDGYSQQQLDDVALELNERPRQTLGFRTPAAKLADIVASIS